MATIRSFTTVEQSRKFEKMLPIDSADMCYIKHSSSDNPTWEFNEDFPPMILGGVPISEITAETLPCWSLAVLLDVLPNGTDIVKDEADTENEKYMCTVGIKDDIICTFGNNPVDACYEMILKLNELKML